MNYSKGEQNIITDDYQVIRLKVYMMNLNFSLR